MLTEKQIEIVLGAQQSLIDRPRRAVVNSEAAFVTDLIQVIDHELARIYWKWSCKPDIGVTEDFSDCRILGNQRKLRDIDGTVKMDDWGYRGT